MVVEKEHRKAVMAAIAIPSNRNIRNKEHYKGEKYQGLKEELERARKVKASLVPVVIRALGTGECLKQIPGKTSRISVQKIAVLIH